MNTTSSLTTVEQIEDFISKHPVEELLTRRMLLNFGHPRIVDSIIYRLVHITGTLVRVAWGCYRKRERTSAVTEEEVAKVKAAAFGKTIVSSPHRPLLDAESQIDLPPPTEFLTSGRSSSFRFGNKDIVFKGASPRKMGLGDGKVARIIRSLWYRGKSKIDEHIVASATKALNSFERIEMGKLSVSMPAWLAEYVYPWRLLERVYRPQDKFPEFNQIWGIQEASALYHLSDRAVGSQLRSIALRC